MLPNMTHSFSVHVACARLRTPSCQLFHQLDDAVHLLNRLASTTAEVFKLLHLPIVGAAGAIRRAVCWHSAAEVPQPCCDLLKADKSPAPVIQHNRLLVL
jgi:hypothetical protein